MKDFLKQSWVHPFGQGKSSFVNQHRRMTSALHLREDVRIWSIELFLIMRTKASERSKRHHERRLLKGVLSLAKTRRVRVRDAWAEGETQIHWIYHFMNPGFKSCIELRIEQEGDHYELSFLRFLMWVAPRIFCLRCSLWTFCQKIWGKQFPQIFWMPAWQNCIDSLAQFITRARHPLHLIDQCCNVDMKTLGQEIADVYRWRTAAVEDAAEMVGRLLLRFEGVLFAMLYYGVWLGLSKFFPAADLLLLESFALMDVAYRPSIVTRESLSLLFAVAPDDDDAPLEREHGHCPLYLEILVARRLELMIALEIM